MVLILFQKFHIMFICVNTIIKTVFKHMAKIFSKNT